MKYKLLSVRGKSATNIGDYIQALASAKFLPRIDGFINREKLADYDGEECVLIMNGWFMHDAHQWPPSDKLHPLFVAFHINSSVADTMLQEKGLNYLKNHEPIGCRDINTVKLLTDHGVDAYYSSCMTLTLGEHYYDDMIDPVDYFVDPFIPRPKSAIEIIKNFIYYYHNKNDVITVCQKIYHNDKCNLKRRLISAGFLRLYSRLFSKHIIVEGQYISQEGVFYKEKFKDDYERLSEAERLVKLYSRARLVVTNRIHCALPCLGLNTPVIFTLNSKDNEINTCRFGGLIDLLNVVDCDDKSLIPRFLHRGLIDENHLPVNTDCWRSYATSLQQKCKAFINNRQ